MERTTRNRGKRPYSAPVRCALLIALAGPAQSAPATPETVSSQVKAGQGGTAPIVVEARNAPVAGVIDELARATAIPIHYSVLPQAPVTATCAGNSLKPVLRCLLGPKTDFLLRTASSSAAARAAPIAEAWILGSSLVIGSSPAGNAAVCTAAAGAPKESAGEKEKADQLRREQAERLLGFTSDSDPSLRAMAISRLAGEGLTDEATIRRHLEAGLADPDPAVRVKAMQYLARRGDSAVATVIQAALGDPDPGVLLTAVDIAGSDPDSIALLESALHDGDETIRSLAEEKLASLRSAGPAR